MGNDCEYCKPGIVESFGAFVCTALYEIEASECAYLQLLAGIDIRVERDKPACEIGERLQRGKQD